jgi:hypothetical protein
MEDKQIPIKKETTNNRQFQPLLDVEVEPERPREEAFEKMDDRDELPFDLPRD